METLKGLFMARVDAFLERTGVGPTTLGRQAVGDPNLVRELRHGRSPTLVTADQLLAFMEGFDEAGVDPVSSRSDRLRDSSQRERRGRPMTRTMVQEMEVPIRIVRLPAVQARTGLGRSTIYVRLAEGSFPRPVQLGACAVGWIEEEVDEWIRKQIALSRGEAPDPWCAAALLRAPLLDDGARAGGAGAKNPLAPRPSRGSVVPGSECSWGVVRGRWRRHRWRGRRGCGGPRERGPSGSRLLRAVGRGARERIGSWAGDQLLLGSPGIAAAAAPASGLRASLRAPGTVRPVSSVAPADPAGWERIYEGSFLEAVLLTQLTGDFPGPVLAMVSVPFYSADRQRILIPRGARVVGTARAVQDPDQSRLAVAFHRLLMPDGSWIDLEFTGLNQAGEGALRDQVDRHYLSTFAAAGAVGVVSGLALAGGSPFGLRAGVGQGLGQSATSVLDRFLNRLPTLTIRAGHRLRIWFTSDVLVPRAGTRQ